MCKYYWPAKYTKNTTKYARVVSHVTVYNTERLSFAGWDDFFEKKWHKLRVHALLQAPLHH